MFNDKKEIINIPNYNSQDEIKSNNINEVKNDNLIKLDIKNNYYDINKNNKNNNQIQTELSTMMETSYSDLNEEESLDKEIESSQMNKLNRPIIKEEQNHLSTSLLFGNSIDDLSPRRLGNMYAFFYFKNKPLIIIGPDCKKYIYNNI